MKVVTWNVNSLGARLPRVLELLAKHAPDVVLAQETKCAPGAFPHAALDAAGYDAVDHSGGQWAGVAVLVRHGLACAATARGLAGELRTDEARWVEATVGGIHFASVYVTNGRALGTEQFAQKLAFLDAAAARAGALRAAGAMLVLGGDFNVTRADADVYDPAAFSGATHVSADERTRFETLLRDGELVDAYRALAPDTPQFTWWDYRAGHFHKGLGLRIDYLLVSAGLGVERCAIDRDFRKGLKPSDHAPLLADLAIPSRPARGPHSRA